MKNIDIINLVNGGALAITANDLDAAQAYKVLKFKKALRKAHEAILDAENDLMKEAGIEDGVAFDKERAELVKSDENPDRLAELNKTFERYAALRNNLYGEDVTLEGVKTLPYDVFHTLQCENKENPRKPLNYFEEALEGVLWKEEEE